MTATPLTSLRPLNMGELLDRAVQLYRRNFPGYVGIGAVIEIPAAVLAMGPGLLAAFASNGAVAAPSSATNTAGNLLLGTVLSTIQEVLIIAALARSVSGGDPAPAIGVIEAYRGLGRAWRPLLRTLLSASLFAVVLLLWSLVPVVGWATGLGLLTFYSAAVVPMAGAIVVLEHHDGSQAVRRGWDLARRRFWPVVRFVGILWFFSWLVFAGPNLLINLVAERLLLGPLHPGGAAPLPISLVVFQSLLSVLVALAYRPLQAISKTLFYLDLRVRTEGLDLAVLARPESHLGQAAAVAAVDAPQAETHDWITNTEMGNFVLLSFIIVAVFFAALVGLLALLFLVRGYSVGAR